MKYLFNPLLFLFVIFATACEDTVEISSIPESELMIDQEVELTAGGRVELLIPGVYTQGEYTRSFYKVSVEQSQYGYTPIIISDLDTVLPTKEDWYATETFGRHKINVVQKMLYMKLDWPTSTTYAIDRIPQDKPFFYQIRSNASAKDITVSVEDGYGSWLKVEGSRGSLHSVLYNLGIAARSATDVAREAKINVTGVNAANTITITVTQSPISFKVRTESVKFAADAYTKQEIHTIDVDCETDWGIGSKPEWVTIDNVTDNTFTISVASDTKTSRTGYVEVVAYGVVRKIAVTQGN